MSERGTTALAATKLSSPTLPRRLVTRDRLTAVLDASVGDATTLILASAPAGSGKSTLLASWLQSRSELAAWLQIEHSDADPARFWLFLAEAVAGAHPPVADALEPVIFSSSGDAETVVPAFVNELVALPDRLILVIDDYHLIDNPAIHGGVERLLELCPPSTTIVVSSRVDPPFRLGRLRVRNQVVEVRTADIRFEPEDAAALLGIDDVADSVVERLVDRTEGWAAGLVLAGLSLQRSPDHEQFVEAFRGDDQLVVDYVTDEFLAGATDEHRQLLLETSILEQFNGSLVDAVTRSTGGVEWIQETARANQLVIGLDRTGTWFRFHHLFRDLLRLEAQRVLPDRLGELHRRAAAWFRAEGDDRQAVHHHLAGGDHAAAVEAMLRVGPQLIADNHIDTLRNTLESIGEPARTDPACALAWGWCAYIGGRFDRAEEWVATVHREAPGLDPVTTAPLRISIAVAKGDVGTALNLARQMAGEVRSHVRGTELATSAGGAFMWAGQADQAAELLDIAVERSTAARFRSAHVAARIHQAVNAFDSNRDAGAAELALATAAELGMSSYHRLAPVLAIRARAATDSAEALATAERAVAMGRRAPGALALAFVLTTSADTVLDVGERSGLAWLTDARSVIDRCPDPGIAGRHLARIEAKHRITPPPAPVSELVERLTERETAVLRYLPTGLSQRDIGAELFVSPNTVKTHCAAIYRKLGVTDRKAAVQAARDLGLL